MNEIELRNELRRIADMLPGPGASISLVMGSGRRGEQPSVALIVYPGNGGHLHFNGATFAEAIAEAEKGIAEKLNSLLAKTIHKMAMAIMEITHSNGNCTDAALRVEGFSQADIEAHHEAAVARAGEIAGGSPFSVAFLSVNSNAA